jgi:hypothetical protein
VIPIRRCASLDALIRDPAADPAANAAAAIGRIAARVRSLEAAKLALCHRFADSRPSVRANALAGLSIAGGRCEDGAPGRRELGHPPAPPPNKNAVLVYVVPLGSATPKAGSSYRVEFADGTVRSGVTDRRGALFDPAAPEGLMTLMAQSPGGR